MDPSKEDRNADPEHSGGEGAELPTQDSSQPRRSPASVAAAELALNLPTLLVLSVLAGVGAWALIDRNYPRFEPSSELAAKMGNPYAPLSPEDEWTVRRLAWENAGWAVGLCGLFLGVALGLGEGLARKHWASLLCGMIGGGILGTCSGALGGFVGRYFYDYTLEKSGSLTTGNVILMHSATFAITGFGVGLALGLTGLSFLLAARTAVQGALGGLCHGMIYLPLAAAALPSENTDRNIPDGSLNRLIWICLAMTLIGLIAGGLRPRRKSAPAYPEASAGTESPPGE